GVIADTEPVDGAGPHVLGHGVDRGGEPEEQLTARFLLEVDSHARLAEVVSYERGARLATVAVAYHRPAVAGGVAPQGLDLDHVGPEERHQLGGVGQCVHLLGGEDGDALQRPTGHRRPSGASRATTPLAMSVST